VGQMREPAARIGLYVWAPGTAGNLTGGCGNVDGPYWGGTLLGRVDWVELYSDASSSVGLGRVSLGTKSMSPSRSVTDFPLV
jgi:hypothetical protein